MRRIYHPRASFYRKAVLIFMDKKTKITDSVYLGLFILLLLAALLVWPAGILKVKQEYNALEYGMAQSGPITESASLSGIFQPLTDRLDSIGIRLSIPNRQDNPGILSFTLKDAQGTVIHTEETPLCGMKNNDYYAFEIPQKLHAGQPYIFELTSQGAGENPPSFWLGSPKTAAPGSAAVYYSGKQLPNNALIMQFTYYGSASLKQSLPYVITLLALAILLLKSWKGAQKNA